MTDRGAIAATRAGKKGRYPDEAATELLVRVGLIHDRAPWLLEALSVEGQRRLRIDPTVLVGETGTEGGGHQRVARIAAAMLDGGQPIRLGEALPSLDREHLRLVVAAVAHAGGSRGPESLYPWPDESSALG